MRKPHGVPAASYTVMVTATEAANTRDDGDGAVTQEVMITVKDVNEAPMVTGGVTTLKIAEYNEDTDG